MVIARDFFINQGLKEAQIEDFIRLQFPSENYSHLQIQRTPLGMKVIIYTNVPGRIIGRGGKLINEMTRTIKEKFNLENIEMDVRGIENPDLDAHIVAKQIVSALSRGINYKKVANTYLKRIMDAGATGAEIIISGKISGSKASTAKFIDGYLKLAGHPATELVDTAYENVLTKPGIIGITVKIMKSGADLKDVVPKKSEEEIKPEEEKKPEEVQQIKERKKVKKTEKKTDSQKKTKS